MKILELYSGIGGMHFALKESGVSFEVKAAVDINTVANLVYKHNFPNTNLRNRNIQGLTAKFINKLDVDTILMSPPCQPFTRNGLQGDISDERTKSFVHLLSILPDLKIELILMENVKGFETSQMRDLFINALEKCHFVYQEFILNPTQIGVPNTRHRYYCIAKKTASFTFEPGLLMTDLPLTDNKKEVCFVIEQILEDSSELSSYFLDDKTLVKHSLILDICYKHSVNSCCFTKAYSRYIEGTGSVFTEKTEDFVRTIYEQISNCDTKSKHFLDLSRELKLRFFTPKEISRLMCFPESFSFPSGLKNRQKYMLLGNSINVKVVAELIKLLQ